MDDALRLQGFRQAKGLTQERLAVEWGVSVRQLRRWERGFGRPQPWMRREIARFEGPFAMPEGRAMKLAVETSRFPAMVFSQDMVSLAGPEAQYDWYWHIYGLDARGKEFHRFQCPEFRAGLEAAGGMRQLIRDGFMSMSGTYTDPASRPGAFLDGPMFVEIHALRSQDQDPLVVALSRPIQPDDTITPLACYFMDA